MRRLIPLLILFCLVGQSVRAQSSAPYPVETRCLPAPTAPPDGWTLDGSLLLSSSGRLHAYQQGWETPRILAFFDPLPRGVLSLDDRWLAFVDYDQQSGVVSTITTQAVRIYSTLDGAVQIVDWPNEFTGLHRVLGHAFHWLADGRLLYSKGDNQNEQWFAIDPVTGEVTPWDEPFSLTWIGGTLAPDGAKAVYTMVGTPQILHTGTAEIPLSLSAVDVLWRPDSGSFLAFTRAANADDPPSQLVLFDLDGQVSDVILTAPDDIRSPRLWPYARWSPDGRYAFVRVDRLLLVDTQRRVVSDPCLTGYPTVAWSPDGTQFALMLDDDSRVVQVVDLEAWNRGHVPQRRSDWLASRRIKQTGPSNWTAR